MSAFADALVAIGLQLEKARGEIVGKIEVLEKRETITGDDLAALAAIKEAAQKLDDIVPDAAPVEPVAPVEEPVAPVTDPETPADEVTPVEEPVAPTEEV